MINFIISISNSQDFGRVQKNNIQISLFDLKRKSFISAEKKNELIQKIEFEKKNKKPKVMFAKVLKIW